jgi:hypothetical protein
MCTKKSCRSVKKKKSSVALPQAVKRGRADGSHPLIRLPIRIQQFSTERRSLPLRSPFSIFLPFLDATIVACMAAGAQHTVVMHSRGAASEPSRANGLGDATPPSGAEPGGDDVEP